MAQHKVIRNDLLTANINNRIVSKVDIKEIILSPSQKAGYHQHPCPVVGHVASGKLLFQVEGELSKILKTGDAFFEPADTPIVHFDNASETEPLKFIAYYLVNNETELIQMLPPKNKTAANDQPGDQEKKRIDRKFPKYNKRLR
ncbi:MAG: cupin domain-containing protein [Ginsengibacter sp.]